jgi:hypothetical protein
MIMMGVEIKPQKKSPKFPQHIWVDADVYQWLISLSAEKGLAPNVIIAQLLRALFDAQQTGKIQPVLTVEKKVKIYKCIFCEFETERLSDIIDHISVKHRDKLRELAL